MQVLVEAVAARVRCGSDTLRSLGRGRAQNEQFALNNARSHLAEEAVASSGHSSTAARSVDTPFGRGTAHTPEKATTQIFSFYRGRKHTVGRESARLSLSLSLSLSLRGEVLLF